MIEGPVRELASKQQLRMALLRWAVVTVPFILLLGFTSARSVPTGAENHWYQALVKPPQTPPDWAFPIAWIVIYALMGLALAMVIHARGSTVRVVFRRASGVLVAGDDRGDVRHRAGDDDLVWAGADWRGGAAASLSRLDRLCRISYLSD
jgi:hypothetical protein